MRYQHRTEAVQAADAAPRLAESNINPVTGLATDYLNHFNEAIMLLEMMPDCPECCDDFLAWRPMSYREHFTASRFKGRDLAIAAYEAANPALRDCLDTLASTMTTVLEATAASMRGNLPPHAVAALARQSAAWLRPLVARAGAVINGERDDTAHDAQAAADLLMKR